MKSGKIYLIKDDDTLQPMEEKPYSNEDLLQTLLGKYPDLLAGEQINEDLPRKWLLISREFGVPDDEDKADRWSLDHLFLDQDGIPTLVEVKRIQDTRIRREVVGQMMDYAANAVVYWPIEKIRTKFEAACEENGDDPTQLISELLDEDSFDEEATELFWDRVKTNLQAQRIRMVFVADEIPSELRRIVEFLNEQMDPAEVLAVEIRQFVGEGIKTLVPKLIGQTAAAQRAKSPGSREKRQWDYDGFMAELEAKHGSEICQVARSLHDWIKPQVSYVFWGEGTTRGSFIPVLKIGDHKYLFFAAWTHGTLEMQFQQLKRRPPFDSDEKRIELLEKLNEIEGIAIPSDGISRCPPIPMAALVNPNALRRFQDCIEWTIQEVKLANVGA